MTKESNDMTKESIDITKESDRTNVPKKITNELITEKIKKEFERLLGVVIENNMFPGSQPVAIEKKDLIILKKKEYVVCEKTDGERIILIIINIDNKPMCFTINRKNEYFYVALSLKKEVFEGTIFDGELIKNKNDEMTYIIHDCLSYNGRNFMNLNHRLRYAAGIDFIVKRYLHKKNDFFKIKTKLFYNFIHASDKTGGIKTTWKHIQETTENCIDGLIFTPIYEKIILGRQNTLFKWKEFNTIDLLVKSYKEKINLYFHKNGNKLFKSFDKDSDNYSIIVNYFSENSLDLKGNIIIEFKYSIKNEIFTPYRIRNDKDKPNGEITVINTLKNIKESIILEDFV
jgi:hypothetical protein